MGKRWSHQARTKPDRRAPLAAVAIAVGLSLASASPALAADTTPPTVTKPIVAFVLAGHVGTSSAPLRLSWQSDDDWTGVERHQLQQQVDGGAWTGVTLTNLLATSATRTVSVGHEYAYRVRAKDVAGNWSAWRTTGPVFRLFVYQETSTKFAWNGTWYRTAVSGAIGGYSKYSNERPATVKFSFTGRAVAWVGMTCSYCGNAPLYLDGVYRTTVNTQGGTANGQQDPKRIMYQRAWSGKGNHSFELRPERTFLHPRVYVDAAYILVPAS